MGVVDGDASDKMEREFLRHRIFCVDLDLVCDDVRRLKGVARKTSDRNGLVRLTNYIANAFHYPILE